MDDDRMAVGSYYREHKDEVAERYKTLTTDPRELKLKGMSEWQASEKVKDCIPVGKIAEYEVTEERYQMVA